MSASDRQSRPRGARRGADPARAQGARAMSERVLAASKRDEDQRGGFAPAASARRVHRPGQGLLESQSVHRGGEGEARGARPCAVRGAAGSRQDDARADRGARARRQFPRHLRPGHRQGGRSRGAAHQSRRSRRAVHRRDPPAQSGGRGNPLSGDGGLPARPHHRRGSGGALGAHRSLALHADRRHHPHRPADHAAQGALRHSDQARILRRRRARGDRAARRASARSAADGRGRARDRAACPRHAARRGTAAPPRARLRERSRAPARSMRRSPTARCRSSRSTRAGSMRSTIVIFG